MLRTLRVCKKSSKNNRKTLQSSQESFAKMLSYYILYLEPKMFFVEGSLSMKTPALHVREL